jgi:hypothetical protein
MNKLVVGMGLALGIAAFWMMAAPAAGVAQSSCVSPPSDLESWWPGDGNAGDIAGGNTATLVNGVGFAAGMVSQAFSFDGGDDYVSVGNPPNLQFGTSGEFTVDAWVNFTSLVSPSGSPSGPCSGPGCDMAIVTKMTAGQNVDGWRLAKISDDHLWFCLGSPSNGCGGDPANSVTSSTVVLPGTWYHVAGVRSSSGIAIYVDGVLEDSKPLASYVNSDSADLLLGKTEESWMSLMYGRIDEAEIHSRALDASEILAIFAAGSAGKCKPAAACAPSPPGLVSWWRGEGNADDSASNNNGTLSPTGVTFAAGEAGQAFSFDGAVGSVEILASPSLDVGAGSGFTIGAWIRPLDASVPQPVAEWNDDAGGYGTHFWIAVSDAGNLFANLIDTSGTHHPIVSTGGVVSANTWQYIALTYDKSDAVHGNATLYVNGEPVAGPTDLGLFTPRTTYDLYLGRRPVEEYRYGGEMDEVELFNRALSRDEIETIYEAGDAGKCSAKNCPPSPQFCRLAEKSILLIKDLGDDARDKLAWKWVRGEATSQVDFADPKAGADYSLCLYAGTTSALIGETRVPAGSGGWAALGERGFRYEDHEASQAGLREIVLKTSEEHESKAVLNGKGRYLPVLATSIPLPEPVTVQLLNSESRICWGAQYAGAQVVKNEKGRFKGKQ